MRIVFALIALVALASRRSECRLLRDKSPHYALAMTDDDDGDEASEREQADERRPPLPPAPEDKSSVNVSVALGKTAQLTCRHRAINSNNRTVAWIRYRDLQLLTVANSTYIPDQRFSAVPSVAGDGWTLQISNAQYRDAGGYECQISLSPKITRYVHLSIVEPTTVILGGAEMHIDVGSTINLTCIIQHTPEPPDYVFWTHNQQTVNYDSKRGGISVMIERGPVTTSSLLIQNADRKDSGSYVCSPSSAPAAQAIVHILEGERTQAMTDAASHLRSSSGAIVFIVFALSLLLFDVHSVVY